MAVKIRLRRMGSKKNPYYRVIVADSRSPRNGRFIEEIGFYNPISKPKNVKINKERATYWMSVGAKPTDTVHYLFKNNGIYEDKAPQEEVAEEAT
ncbi:MAG: 30S ribosomal protein S16, partial [Tissierellia bacterium]|nr:30S ribosomal protein S16 [Tissierellia bacterium]